MFADHDFIQAVQGMLTTCYGCLLPRQKRPSQKSNSVFFSDDFYMIQRYVTVRIHTNDAVPASQKRKSVSFKGNISPFDLASLRWSKIIICTDADEDGFQIRTLLLTLFYKLLPTLIDEGRIYIAETPLYEITCKDETYFAYDEPEKTAILEKIGNRKYTIQRSKGLGENEPEMMWQTTMNPETRRLIRVSKADAAATEEIFDTLLGNNLVARKEFIFTYGSSYADDVDI